MTTLAAPTSVPSFDKTDVDGILDFFYREGYALVRNVLPAEQIPALKKSCDRMFDDPVLRWKSYHPFPFVASRLYELDPIFARIAASEPLFSLVERVLGPGFQSCGMNVIRNPPGEAITTFHVDDGLQFPLPPEITRFDARMRMPVFWLALQLPLTDLEDEIYGPSQFVPGSHYSGREPNDQENPSFEGRGPVSILSRAGDVYLHNPQCWHRGSPNRSDRMRYLFNIQYGCRMMAARFHPPVQHHLREMVLAGADERMRQVFGRVNCYATDEDARPEGTHDPYAGSEKASAR